MRLQSYQVELRCAHSDKWVKFGPKSRNRKRINHYFHLGWIKARNNKSAVRELKIQGRESYAYFTVTFGSKHILGRFSN